MSNFTYFNMFILCMWLQVMIKVKFMHQGEGHIRSKTKYLHPFRFYVAHTLCKQVVCIRLKCILVKVTVLLLTYADIHFLHNCTMQKYNQYLTISKFKTDRFQANDMAACVLWESMRIICFD